MATLLGFLRWLIIKLFVFDERQFIWTKSGFKNKVKSPMGSGQNKF